MGWTVIGVGTVIVGWLGLELADAAIDYLKAIEEGNALPLPKPKPMPKPEPEPKIDVPPPPCPDERKWKCCIYKCTNEKTGTVFKETITVDAKSNCPKGYKNIAEGYSCELIGSTPGPCPKSN